MQLTKTCGLVVLGLAIACFTPARAHAVIKVACVGASTTKGSGSTEGHHFPDELQALLGSNYKTYNYGVSAAGVLKKAMVSYWNTAELKAALALNPDIVTFWLGGSDTKPENWEANEQSFLADMVELIKRFQDLPSHPKVVVMLSVAQKDASGVRRALVEGPVQMRQRLAAAMTGSPLVDLQAVTMGHTEYFPDGIHPNDLGTKAIAKATYEVIISSTATDAGADASADAGAGGSGGGSGTGGATSGTGGAATGSGGSTGGSGGSATAGSGGTTASTGGASGGSGGAGGSSSSTGGSRSGTGGGSSAPSSGSGSSGGCSVAPRASGGAFLGLLALGLVALGWRRRRPT